MKSSNDIVQPAGIWKQISSYRAMREGSRDTNKSVDGVRTRISACGTLRKLTIERFVLTHFFFVFFVSFTIGIMFLHSTTTLWQWSMNEDTMVDILLTATNGFTSDNVTPQSVQGQTVVNGPVNETKLSASYFTR